MIQSVAKGEGGEGVHEMGVGGGGDNVRTDI